MADTGLLNHAIQMEKHAEALATGLAHAGAPPETTKVVSQCADVGRSIVKALGKQDGGKPPAGQEQAPPADQQQAPPQEAQQPKETQRKGDLGDASRNMAAEYNRRRKQQA